MTLALIEKSTPPKLLQVWVGYSAVNVNVPGVLQAYNVGDGWASEDGAYAVIAPVPFQMPEGKIPAAPPTYSIDDAGVVTESIEVMDVPPPPAPLPPPIPTVTMRQARLALLGAGLLDQIDAAVAAAGAAAKIEWEYAQEVRRDSPLIAQLAAGLNLDAATIDQLFEQAKGL